MRLSLGLIIALLVNFGLFLLMQNMTRPEVVKKQFTEDIRLLDFVRLKQEASQPKIKKRVLPKKPVPPKQALPPLKTVARTARPKTATLRLDVPNIEVPLNISGGPYLGDVANTVQIPSALDDEVMPILRISPQYPRLAIHRGIEGAVTVRFTITRSGSVRDPVVVKAKPENVFDKAALKAILKWKFKPEYVDGQPVERQASQEIEFKLE